MKTTNRPNLFLAVVLIGIGLIFLILNLIPGMDLRRTWPVIFFVLSAGFFLPAFVWPEARRGLAGMFIPGAILAALGLIFIYNSLSGEWSSWAYAWTVIPAGVGLGLFLASVYGGWGRTVSWVGIWMMLASLAIFSLLAALFGGGSILSIVGPVVLILIGVLLLVRPFKTLP
jgi:hypothetical protein